MARIGQSLSEGRTVVGEIRAHCADLSTRGSKIVRRKEARVTLGLDNLAFNPNLDFAQAKSRDPNAILPSFVRIRKLSAAGCLFQGTTLQQIARTTP